MSRAPPRSAPIRLCSAVVFGSQRGVERFLLVPILLPNPHHARTHSWILSLALFRTGDPREFLERSSAGVIRVHVRIYTPECTGRAPKKRQERSGADRIGGLFGSYLGSGGGGIGVAAGGIVGSSAATLGGFFSTWWAGGSLAGKDSADASSIGSHEPDLRCSLRSFGGFIAPTLAAPQDPASDSLPEEVPCVPDEPYTGTY